jgi:hypothetical protein
MISALSALAHMASQETEPLFDHMSSYVRRVCGFVKSPASSLDLKAIACRCVANFSLLSKLRPLIIQEGTYEALVAFVAAEAENLEDEDRPLIPALEEAVAAINNILAKEKSLMDSVGSKLVHSLHRFLTSPQSSITLREQSAWILARILSDGMAYYYDGTFWELWFGKTDGFLVVKTNYAYVRMSTPASNQWSSCFKASLVSNILLLGPL